MSSTHGSVTGKDVQMLPEKHEPNQPDCGAVQNIILKGHAAHTANPTDLKLDTQIQLNVLDKRSLLDHKCLL